MDQYNASVKKNMSGGASMDLYPSVSGPKSVGGSLLEDMGKLAVPLGLIAAKEGMQYIAKKRVAKSAKPAKPTAGGGIVADIANLSIPLGFVAAERVLQAHMKSKAKKDTKKDESSKNTTTTKKKKATTKKSASTGRRAAYGGFDDGMYGSDAMMQPPVAGGYSDADLMPLGAQNVGGGDSFFDNIMHTLPKEGGSSGSAQTMSKKLGGAALRQKHAAIAAEFRAMAAEIGAFLDKKAKSKAKSVSKK